jgi:hypothetical protein
VTVRWSIRSLRWLSFSIAAKIVRVLGAVEVLGGKLLVEQREQVPLV